MRITRITSTAFLSSLLLLAGSANARQGHQDENKDHPGQQQSNHEQAKPEQQHAQPQQQRQDQNRQQGHAQQQQRQNQNQHAQQQQQDRSRQQEQRQNQNNQQQQRQGQNRQQQHAQQQRQDQNRQQGRAQQQQQRQNQSHQRQYAQQQRGNDRPRRTQEQQRVERSAWQEHRSQRWDSDHRTWRQRGGYNGYRIPDDRYRGYFGPNHGFRINSLPFMVVGGYPRFQYEGYWISAVDPWPEYWGNDWYDNDDVYVSYVDNGYYLYNRRYPRSGVAISISF